MRRALTTLVLVVGVIIAAYGYRGPLGVAVAQTYEMLAPCTREITYSIGEIDPRFHISDKEIIPILASAADIWGSEIDRTLFRYEETGGTITINLIYDDRQETSEKLASLDISISSDTAAYETLGTEYEKLVAAHEAKRSRFEADKAALRRDDNAYQAKVVRINASGGATPKEYEQLQAEKAALDARWDALATRSESLNKEAASADAMLLTLKRIAQKVDARASAYNAEAAEQDEEFNEALYVTALGKEEINVYQFDSRARLQRVLSHEFGHALALDHVDDEDAIMYRLNESTNDEPTAADIAELRIACRMSQ